MGVRLGRRNTFHAAALAPQYAQDHVNVQFIVGEKIVKRQERVFDL
jgi:hypothetical protein